MPGERPSAIKNRLRRQIEAKALAMQAVVEAARPFAQAASPSELASLPQSDLDRLRQALKKLDELG